MKLYLTRNEAAELLGVTPQTISNYLAKGLLVESTTRNPESKAIRILGSSVRNLMKEGYDIIEQYKAMEACQKEVRQMREDLAIQKDELEKTHQLMTIRDKFYNNIREVAEILTAFLKGNDILQGIREEYVIDLLSGKRWEHVAWRKGVSKASIRSIYVKALRLLADGKKPSNAELKDEIANLKIQLNLEKKRNAVLEEIVREKQVDDDIMKIVDEKVTIQNAFKLVDEVLSNSVQGICDIITDVADVNIDFADVKTTMQDKGIVHMGVGRASGKNRAEEALKMAIENPLLETSIKGAKSVLVYYCGDNINMVELTLVNNTVHEAVDTDAQIIFGAMEVNDEMNDEMQVTIVAAGFSDEEVTEATDLDTKEVVKAASARKDDDDFDIPSFLSNRR